MTGRPGCWTMKMNGGSSAPHLACTPCVPLFVHCLIRVEAEGLLDYQGRAGIISIVRWNLRPVIFGVENFVIFLHFFGDLRPGGFPDPLRGKATRKSNYGSLFWAHIFDCLSLSVVGKWLSKPLTTDKPLISH